MQCCSWAVLAALLEQKVGRRLLRSHEGQPYLLIQIILVGLSSTLIPQSACLVSWSVATHPDMASQRPWRRWTVRAAKSLLCDWVRSHLSAGWRLQWLQSG